MSLDARISKRTRWRCAARWRSFEPSWKSDISELRVELKGDISELKGEMVELKAKFDGLVVRHLVANVPLAFGVAALVLAAAKLT